MATAAIDNWLEAQAADPAITYRRLWTARPVPDDLDHTVTCYLIGRTMILVTRHSDHGWDVYICASLSMLAHDTLAALDRTVKGTTE